MNGQIRITDDQKLLFDHAERFGRERLLPFAERMDQEEWWPDEVFPELGELGYLGVTVPERYGGAGLGPMEAGLVAQAFARWNHAFSLSWAVHDSLCTAGIYNNGSSYLREKYLPGLCSGAWLGCLGLTEPGAGSDALGSMRTRAVRKGDRYIVSGTKIFITNGPIADICLLYAKTMPGRGSKGITAFVVETDSPGFSVAQKLVKMGFRGSQTGELVFDNVEVPRENVLGVEHEGHRVVMSGLDFERALLAPINVGIAERALELSVEYAKVREQFGQRIGNFQMVQSRLADMYVWVETMRCYSREVLSEAERVDHGEAGRGGIHAKTAASMLYCADMCNRVLDYAVQIHGGGGYMWESEVNRLFRATKMLEIGAGTTEVRKMIIAKELLR